tara:strand:+ start:25759 stop:26742 length:984 start_codon:yes stop_codon:yes gene_type:complete
MSLIFEARASIIIYKYISKLKKNKKFILPANVCPIVPMIFLKAGIAFDFIDISKQTLEIDKNLLYERLSENPKKYNGILWVRTYGADYNNEEIFKTIKNINSKIIIIDDRCLQIPKFDPPKSICDLVIYSTGYSKYVDIGWGGYGFTNNKYLESDYNLTFEQDDLDIITNKIRKSLINNSPFNYNDNNWLGGEKKINSFREYKNHINKTIPISKATKVKMNTIYADYLPKEIQLPKIFNNWRFNILVKNKSEIMKKINSKNLFSSSHYPSLPKIFLKPECNNAKILGDHVINLNNDFRLNEKQAKSLCKIINKNVQITKISNFLIDL